ncbi:hypothetical protein HK096_008155, partial [Nowakowskiella sp. JEL0078]
MGNSPSSQSQLLKFDENEQFLLKSSFALFSKDSTQPILLDSIRSHIPDFLFSYFEASESIGKNQIRNIYINDWASAAFLFCKSNSYELTSWIKSKIPNDNLERFCRSIANGFKYYSENDSSLDYLPSDRFIEFMKSSSKLLTYNDFDSVESVNESTTPAEAFQNSIFIQKLWGMYFNGLFFGFQTKGPILLNQTKEHLLSFEDVWIIDTAISDDAKSNEWTSLFSTQSHGKSWTVFKSNATMSKSTLIVVRDQDGSVFGGFASQPWNTQPKFYGDNRSFLFSLMPKIAIYPPTGFNSNFQYLQSATRTYPNGLGFGGQFEYFGLWLNENFATGHSKANPRSSTYGNLRLSQREEFVLDSVEVYGILPFTDEELGDIMQDKSSVLASNPEAQAFLEMAGKRLYSKEI